MLPLLSDFKGRREMFWSHALKANYTVNRKKFVISKNTHKKISGLLLDIYEKNSKTYFF